MGFMQIMNRHFYGAASTSGALRYTILLGLQVDAKRGRRQSERERESEQTCSRRVVTTITLINFHNIKCTKGTEQKRRRERCWEKEGACEKMSSD